MNIPTKIINRFFTITLLFCSISLAQAVNEKDGLSVITGTQVTYSLTVALLLDTDIEVVNIPADGRRLESLKDYIARRKDKLADSFKAADAVVSMGNVLGYDPIFRYAREANIHLVNIDAAQPWSFDESGVSIVQSPTTNVDWSVEKTQQKKEDSPYFWLSMSNTVRMTDIIGADLSRVFPAQQKQIVTNQDNLKKGLLKLAREYQDKFLNVDNITVFALSNEFVYLTNGLGIYVDGYFLKQDIDWTQDDLSNLTKRLKDRDIKVVIHKWEPKEEIIKAITDADATFVILNNADPGMTEDRKLLKDGYQQIMKNNLETLYKAMYN